jgi:hypothetical protein
MEHIRSLYSFLGGLMEQEKQIITTGIDESQNNVVDLTKVTSETEPNIVTGTIDNLFRGKTSKSFL